MTEQFLFTQPSGVNLYRLSNEIRQEATITVGLDFISYTDPNLDVFMSGVLTGTEETTLGNVASGHIAHHIHTTVLQVLDHAAWMAKDDKIEQDYKFKRAAIAKVVAASGWSQLPDRDKKIAANWFVVDGVKRAEVYTLDEQIGLAARFHKCSIESRSARFKAASIEIYNRLDRSEQMIVTGAVEKSTLPKLYVEYGVEGTLEDGIPGLFDYMLGREDTPWAGSGLLQQNFQPSGVTMTQLVDKVMSILTSGLYNYHQFKI